MVIYGISDHQPSRATPKDGMAFTTFIVESYDQPVNHPPSVFAVSPPDLNQFMLPEHAPDLAGAEEPVDPATFTASIATLLVRALPQL